jgi:hypothetical protein
MMRSSTDRVQANGARVCVAVVSNHSRCVDLDCSNHGELL